MRKLKLQVQITVDGFVGGPDGQLDWMSRGWGLEPVIEIADTCDCIVMGRKMSGEFMGHWENIVDNVPESREQPLAQRMVNMRKIIFSRSQKEISGRNAEITNGELVTTINSLKNQVGKDLLVYGGANFASNLIEHNLIDEYILFTNPVAIGSGLSLFKQRKNLILTHSVTYKNLVTANTYIPG